MKGILNTTVTDVSHQYVLERKKLDSIQRAVEPIKADLMYAELFEQLLLFDRVSIILGSMDNSALAALVVGFGFPELERAIALEVIEVVLPRTMSMVGMGPEGAGRKDPSLLSGVPPVVYGVPQGGAFGNPEEAVLDALKYVAGYKEHEKQSFAKRIAPHIKLGSLNDGDKAVKIVTDAYESDALRPVGLPFVGTSLAFSAESRFHFQHLTSEIEKTIFVAENNYGLYNTPAVYSIAKQAVGLVEDALNIQKGGDTILEEAERIPNLRALYLSRKAGFATAMQLRERNDNALFRKWIQDASNPAERSYIISKYIEAISKPTGFSETIPGQLLKGLFMQGIGPAVGAAAALASGGISVAAGGLWGYAAGAVAKPVIEAGANLFLDKIAGSMYKGWTPKQFVNRVKKISEGPSIDLQRLGL